MALPSTPLVLLFKNLKMGWASSPGCKCGIIMSMSNRNPMPHSIPTAAGTTAMKPSPPCISMLGISSDHTAAATITPEANPSKVRCRFPFMLSRMMKTNAAPSTVPAKGIISAVISPFITQSKEVGHHGCIHAITIAQPLNCLNRVPSLT